MDSEENATSCSVCREIYSDPRSLACGHSFCLKCLKRIAGNDKRFPCPICRRYVDLRGTNVDQLPKNFVLCNVIEAREKKHPSMCLDHNKSLDLFCQGCDEVICSKCMSMQHKGHAIEDIEIIYIERNKQYGEFLERTKHFTSMIEEQRYDVQQSRILMEKNIDSISNRVDNTFKKWNDALQKQHNAICSYLHQERECKKQMFVEAERILAGSMTTVTRLDTEINKLRSKGTAVVVQQYGSIKARQEDTERKILQDIQTCSTPPDNLVLEVYAPWIEEAINNIKHIDMKQTQARPGRQKIAEIQEENVILKRECEKLQNTVQELKKSNQNGSGGQVDGKKGDMQKTPSNQNGPGGQGDGKKGGTQQSKSNGTGGQGDDKKGGMQQTPSSPNNMAGPVDGTKGSGLEPPSSSEADASIVSFIEKLLDALCNLLENNTQDYSALDLPSLAFSTKIEGALEEKIKTIHDKAIEMAELCIDRNSEAKYSSELLKELSDFSLQSTYSKRKELSKPPKKVQSTEGEIDHSKKHTFQHEENRHSRHFKHLDDNFSSAKNAFNKQIEADYTAQLLKTLSEFPQTYDKTLVEKMLRDPQKLFIHADEDHDKLKDPKAQGETEKNVQIMNMKELSEAVSRIIREMEEKQRSTEKVKNLTQELDNRRDQTHQLEDEVKALRFRLSELASAKLTHDNPAITDLSDPDRPTKLAEKYFSLYDNQWTDAFAELTKSDPKASEKALTEQLLNILTDGFNFCKEVRQDQVTKLEQLMLNPAESTKSSQGNSNQVNEIFTKHLRDAAKESSIVASENMFKAFVSNTKKNKKYGNLMTLCDGYIEECVRLCWLMQVQSPPVSIDLGTKEGQPFSKDTYREYTSSGKKIAFVVWPALFLHEKGPLLIKGVAQGK